MSDEPRTLDDALALLQQRAEENQRLTQELEDTNRGVLALYAELDDRASLLRTANDIKDQFLSHLSHEFRTPLNSISALSQMLAERGEDTLSDDQKTQIGYIRKSARELLDMVNDLLDIAKIEAGQLNVRNEDVFVSEVFGSLRGVLKPLVPAGVELLFDEADTLPLLHTDAARLTQILRNLISNALQFTTDGTVRVGAVQRAPDMILFSVADTGIGIEPSEQERIFQAFTQVDSPMQRNRAGTGLGLSLSRKLAGLIGGTLSVKSEPGDGSTFTLEIPVRRASAGS